MIEILFYIVLWSIAVLYIGLAVSILFPNRRLWPPPSKNSWQYWAVWTVIMIPAIGIPLLEVLDWDTSGFTFWWRFPLSLVLLVVSSAIILWGLRTLSLHQSFGLKGELVTSGPYKYSQNPQYVGLVIFYLGVILFANSLLASITGMLYILVYIFAPFSEEPWLIEQFGKDYLEYQRTVPRFIGRRRKHGANN